MLTVDLSRYTKHICDYCENKNDNECQRCTTDGFIFSSFKPNSPLINDYFVLYNEMKQLLYSLGFDIKK